MPRELADEEELNFDKDRDQGSLRGLQRRSERVRPRIPRNRADEVLGDTEDVRGFVDRCLRNGRDE
jgi:hypothetical protein